MTHDFLSNSAPDDSDIRLDATESKSYLAFDRWMDEQLIVLVARWIHAAAPNANRPDFVHERVRRQKQSP